MVTETELLKHSVEKLKKIREMLKEINEEIEKEKGTNETKH